MNVLFISNDPALFAPESSVRERMRRYAKEIGTLHILSRAPTGAVSIREDGLTIHPYQSSLLEMFFMADRARSIIRREQIDVVSAQDPFEYGRIALSAVRGTRAKLHIQVHTDFLSPWFTLEKAFRAPHVPPPVKNRIRCRIADAVLPHADGIRVVSERIKTSLIQKYGDRIPEPVVIPIMVGTNIPDAVPLPPHPFTFALMTVSRLEPEKRIEDILMAIARLGPRYASVGLFVVGAGRERHKLELLAERLGLSARVIFLGERADAWGLMRSATAYIQASAYEGYGRTLVEAALARVPIITTDVGIVGEVFKADDVHAVPPGDPAALSVALLSLVEDHGARKTLVMNAEHSVRNHLTTMMDQSREIADDLAKTLNTSNTPHHA